MTVTSLFQSQQRLKFSGFLVNCPGCGWEGEGPTGGIFKNAYIIHVS